MISFVGARKKLGEKVSYVLAVGSSFARRIRARASISWPRVSLSTNIEQEDVGNLEEGGEIEINNSTMLENQNVVQLQVLGVQVGEGNQDDVQGGDPDDVVGEDPTGESIKLTFAKLKVGVVGLMWMNVGICFHLDISDIPPLKRDLLRVVSVFLAVGHAVLAVLTIHWVVRDPSGRLARYAWVLIVAVLLIIEVLVTISNFA